MADEDGDLFGGLPAYIDEDPTFAKTKEERAKRKAGGRWGKDKIQEKELERMKEWAAKHPPFRAPAMDLQVESSASPMRHLPVSLKGPQLVSSANIISVKLIDSAIGFPLDVYGTIFVRDELDCKRICLFRRDHDNCQRVSSMDESLSLTGPSRGIVAFKNLYFEFDLKYKKNHLALMEGVLCNWFLKDSALNTTSKAVRNRFVGKTCTLDLTYVPAHRAVEVAIEVRIFEILKTKLRIDGSTDEKWLPFNRKMEECS